MAIYADELRMFALDADGGELMTAARSSWTGFASPVVADVDNDGAAEVLVVSNRGSPELPVDQTPPTVQMLQPGGGTCVPEPEG